jgi:murein DD-endopeptidase MepM/ murein hydrolase activator NlpD
MDKTHSLFNNAEKNSKKEKSFNAHSFAEGFRKGFTEGFSQGFLEAKSTEEYVELAKTDIPAHQAQRERKVKEVVEFHTHQENQILQNTENIKNVNTNIEVKRIETSKQPEKSPEKLSHQSQVSDYFHVRKIGKPAQSKTSGNLSFREKVENFYQNSKEKYVQFSKKSPAKSYLAMTALMVFGVFLFDTGGNMFKASLTDKATQFDGTVYPFAQSPNWFKTGGKNNKKFSEYAAADLVPAPRYNAQTLLKDQWAKDVVNPKITYSIVYAGQYKFNHQEYKGSHPAIDIKLPEGTPILSIANGVVTKASEKTTGFGKHVVIRHDGVPQYGTLYSSYSHMSSVGVKVGQIVKKGEVIGKVGSTGSSTTPHIHFQIDQASSPFKPYWPFTGAEAKAAGVSFTEAVNIGLGQDKVKKYTVHPFDFVNKYLGGYGESLHASATEATPAVIASTPKPTPVATSTPEKSPEKNSAEPKSLSISTDKEQIFEGESVELSFSALDENEKTLSDFSEQAELIYKDGDENKKLFINFKEGTATQNITIKNKGNILFRVKYENISESARVSVKREETEQTPTPSPSESPETTPEASTETSPETSPENTPKPTTESTPTATPKPTPAADEIFIDVSETHKHAEAIEYLKENEIIDGYADGTFKPEKVVSRAEAIKMIFGAFKMKGNENIDTPFSDVPLGEWFSPFILAAYDLEIVDGYSDGRFKPEKSVTRAEYFKIFLNSGDIILETTAKADPFDDTEKTQWFAPYAEFAKEEDLLTFGKNFQPSKEITRGEVAETIYRFLK